MKKLFLTTIFAFFAISIFAQKKQAGPHDFGRMWTFENPPKEWLTKAYNFTPGDKWFEDVRLSALRMNTGCSASFVSPDGLIMTNHHCSRDAVLEVQQDGEDIMGNGFFAANSSEERLVKSVFFEQLIKFADVTPMIDKYVKKSKASDEERKKTEAIDSVKNYFRKMADWKDLRLQIIPYYSGVKYSLYGYKKFDNIRLVAIPEAEAAFYGGDPDNFTYPRYDMDFTFWRAYDDNGQPVNSSAHYFKFNPEGATENELVFVVGNPGNTERYRTVAQLDYDRKFRYPPMLDLFDNILTKLQAEYDKDPNEFKLNEIFGLSNSYKAYSGIQGGLMNDKLYSRKVEIENLVRKNHKGQDYWAELEKEYTILAPHSWAMTILGQLSMGSQATMLMSAWANLEEKINSGAPADEVDDAKDQLKNKPETISDEEDLYYLNLLLKLADKYIPKENKSLSSILNGKTPEQFMEYLKKESKFFNGKGWKSILEKDPKKILKADDPFILLSRAMIPQYKTAVEAFQNSSDKREQLEGKIAQEYFRYFGDILPPDATFTLRISDGLVKGYNYNGTEAPYKTTFFGMYDRNASFNGEYPWRLPKAWQNPPMELLSKPMNFVSTNDIIGGNSGSAIINKNKEVVGLIFDGNIESLPGNFIFDEESNRAVSVHSTGILSALKYIYKADRLVGELAPSMK
ncbi:MAG: S46 family peptidase [Deltaproteobacteria bacterium]